MNNPPEAPFDALEKIFHEPKRLAIMSALCAAESELTFIELKEACDLTDGNLNRHLKVLEENRAVTIRKRFVHKKPCTSVKITDHGLKRFSQYLDALTEVIDAAREAMPLPQPAKRGIPFGRTAQA